MILFLLTDLLAVQPRSGIAIRCLFLVFRITAHGAAQGGQWYHFSGAVLADSAMSETLSPFTSVEEAVEEIRNGRMIVLVDDEDRETKATSPWPPKESLRKASTLWPSTAGGSSVSHLRSSAATNFTFPSCPPSTHRSTAPLSAKRSMRGSVLLPASVPRTAPSPFSRRSIPRPSRRTLRARAMSFLCARARAVCWSAPVRPRLPWIWPASRVFHPPESSAKS